MSVRSELVGIIVIETTTDDLFAFWSSCCQRRLTNRIWTRATHAAGASSVVMADLPRLGHELDREFSRMQDRLAA